MSMLSLEEVSKSYGEGREERVVLRDVSMEIEPSELAVVWGLRGSGRSTLLRTAAGIEPPDKGIVRFEGADLAIHGERLLGPTIGYCQKTLRITEGQSVLDHAMVGLLARWVPPSSARSRAREALERVGAGHCTAMRERELSSAEIVRVALARTLALEPRLIVIDEPVKGVELRDRDGILALLRSIANEGIAVLTSTGESTGLSESDHALTLGSGELHSVQNELAPVLELRQESRRANG